MARKQEVLVVESGNVVPFEKLTPAAIVGVNTNLQMEEALLPEEFQGQKLEVLQTGFNPSVDWVNKGNFVAGVYTGYEEKVGPNNAMLYNFIAKNGKPFSVWGTTVLDRAFDAAFKSGTLKPGYLTMITYVADVPSKFEANPTKLFHIQVVKK